MTRSWTSGSYEISCTARANEYKGKSPGYLQLNHIAIGSTKSIVDNIVQWKRAAHSTARAPERGDFVGSSALPPPPPSSAAAKDVFIPPK
jgi:hypothetical protein